MILITLGSAILGILLVGLLFRQYALSSPMWKSEEATGELTRTTQYGDVFIDAVSRNITLRAGDNPEKQFIHRLYWTCNKKTGVNFQNIHGVEWIDANIVVQNNQPKFMMPIQELASVSSINYYIVANDRIVWTKQNNRHYCHIDVEYVKWVKKGELPDLIPLGQTLLATGNWKWYHTFARFLVSNGDSSALAISKRYAHNQFTAHELSVNQHSRYQCADIVRYATELSKQKVTATEGNY